MAGICEGRVVVVTGAGRGIGRGHALEYARQGAKVIVNDLGGEVDGSGKSTKVADVVVEEIQKEGGEAAANYDDVSDFDGAKNLVDQAVKTFGKLDVVVNNAGILRDRMLFNMTPEEWDAVIRVHLRSTFCTSRVAAEMWREKSKAGEDPDARIINTSSSSGLIGNPGQSNYGAAKAGIAAFTIIAARELERYGVTVNAISPGARTRMTENLGGGRNAQDVPEGQWDPRSPDNIAPLVVWLGSSESRAVTGRVFAVSGGTIGIMEGWDRGPMTQKDTRWDPAAVGPAVEELLAKSKPAPSMRGRA